MIPFCPHCGAQLGPWENARGCLTCRRSSAYTIADRAVSLMERMDQPLPYWDIKRLLRENGRDVWEPSLKSVLATDRRMCWAGAGTYGLFRHGLLPGVRNLSLVGGVYLHAGECTLGVYELEFVLKFVGYTFRDLSLRFALQRGLDLGIYRSKDIALFTPTERSAASQTEAARALGLPRGALFDAVVKRAAGQVSAALDEMNRRRGC